MEYSWDFTSILPATLVIPDDHRLLAPAAIKLCVTLGCCRIAGSNFARANLRSEQLKNTIMCSQST